MSETTEDTRSTGTVVTHTIIWMLTTISSVAGNSLILIAYYRNRRLRTITSFYVLSLVIIDLIMATFGYPFNTIAAGLRQWPFGYPFCQFNGFLSHLWTVLSINILTLTAINRYFCIVKPRFYLNFFTKKKTLLSILFVWLSTLAAGIAMTVSTPVIFEWHPYYLFCQMESSDSLPVVTAVFLTGFVFALICFTLFFYGRVYWVLRRHNSAIMPFLRDANVNSQGNLRAHEIHATRVLLAAVMTFFVCWIPATIVSTLERVARAPVPSFWQSFDTLVFACSSWINVVIYNVMNRAMRKEILRMLRCGKEN